MATMSKPDLGTARPNGGSAPVVEKAKRTAEDLKDVAFDRARGQVESRASEGKEAAASQLGGIARAIRSGGGELGFAGDYVERAADQIEAITNYVRDKDLPEIVDDVERFARREPAIFLGGTFAIGLLAARFLKSTSRRRETLDLEEDDFDTVAYARPMRPQIRDIASPPRAASYGTTGSSTTNPGIGSAGIVPGGGSDLSGRSAGGMNTGGMNTGGSNMTNERPRMPDLSTPSASPTTGPTTNQSSYGANPTQFGSGSTGGNISGTGTGTGGIGSGTGGTGGTGTGGIGGGTS